MTMNVGPSIERHASSVTDVGQIRVTGGQVLERRRFVAYSEYDYFL
jgi:hypothetical protein